MKKIKQFKAGLLIFVSVIGMTVIGCASYTHFQSIRNETGSTVMRVFIRDTGTTDWGSVKNVRARTNSDGIILRRQDGSVAYYDEFTMNDRTQVIFFQDFNNSETPRHVRNKDIQIFDNNNMSYTKINVPIHFNTSKKVDLFLVTIPTTITASDPIIFTARDKDPIMTVLNNTGFTVRIGTRTLSNGDSTSTQIQRGTTQGNFSVNYSINDYSFSKEVEVSSGTSVVLTERPPILTVINNTGFSLSVTRPFRQGIESGGRYLHAKQSRSVNSLHIISYQIGNASYEEQVALNDADATITLTKRPPTITIINNIGATINMIWLRIPGAPAWTGGNINIRGGTVHLGTGQAQTGDLSGSIINGDSMRIWMGNITLSGEVFDVRLTDVNNVDYVRSNVQLSRDMTLTFTQRDKR